MTPFLEKRRGGLGASLVPPSLSTIHSGVVVAFILQKKNRVRGQQFHGQSVYSIDTLTKPVYLKLDSSQLFNT